MPNMGSESRRGSESCTLQPDRVSFSRTTSDTVRQSKEHHEVLRRISQTNIKASRQSPVRAASPISKDVRYKRCTSPKIPTNKAQGAISQSVSNTAGSINFLDWMAAFRPSQGEKAARCFKEATKYPPMSKSSLSELEVSCIIGNPKLRHDINFDRELHFRPNLDGDRGRRKLQQADDYWLALEPELEKYGYMLTDPKGASFRWTSEWLEEFRGSRTTKRIPRLFQTIKDILYSLTPDKEVPGVEEALDVPLIMQQIERGVYNLQNLANWLAALLKAHCAPMRDQWVERMVDLLERGWATFNARMIVEGLKELFGIMEAMKLDIANHQIRYFRHMLLENTVRFERRYYTARIVDGQINTAAAQNWINNTLIAEPSAIITTTKEQQTPSPPQQPRPTLSTFTNRFIASILASNPTLPETFALDHDRLLLLRCDAHSLIYTDIILSALTSLLHMSPIRRSTAYTTRATTYLRTVIPILIGRGASDARWASKLGHIAIEVARAVFGRFSLPGEEDVNMLDRDQHRDHIPEEDNKVNIPTMISYLESYFSRHLCPSSDMFTKKAEALCQRLTARVTTDVLAFQKTGIRLVGETLLAPRNKQTLTTTSAIAAPVALGATATAGDSSAMDIDHAPLTATTTNTTPATPSSTTVTLDSDSFLDIASRLTHIAALHWRVWAPLVYLRRQSETLGSVMDVEWEAEGWGEWVAGEGEEEDDEQEQEQEQEQDDAMEGGFGREHQGRGRWSS